MAKTTITFEDPNNPPNPGAVRTYPDGAAPVCSDHGCHDASMMQTGWKIKRPNEPWLTILTVVTE